MGLEAALDGRPGFADCDPPKKSIPNRDSPGLVALGAEIEAAGDGFVLGRSAVFGRTGGVKSSPKRSTLAAAGRLCLICGV